MKKLKNDVRKLHRQTIKWHNDKFDKLTGIKKVNGKLKLFTPEAKETINLKPEITRKMNKVLNSVKKAILHLNILGLLLIVACGSDNPVNNGNPPPTPSNDSLVLTIDSLALYGSGINDTTFFNVLQPNDSLKATFTIETNCTALDTAYCAGSFGNRDFEILSNSMPNSFVFYGSYTVNTVFVFVQMITSNQRYIRLKNLKVYKVNSV